MPDLPARDQAPEEVRLAKRIAEVRSLQIRMFRGDRTETTMNRLREAETGLDAVVAWIAANRPERSPLGRMARLAGRMREHQRLFIGGNHSPAFVAQCRGLEREADEAVRLVLTGPRARQGDLFAGPGLATVGEVVDAYTRRRPSGSESESGS